MGDYDVSRLGKTNWNMVFDTIEEVGDKSAKNSLTMLAGAVRSIEGRLDRTERKP